MTIPTGFAFIMRAPPLSYVSNIYYLSFSNAVWICSILMIFLTTIVIALTFKVRASANEQNTELKFSDFFLLAIASLCQMGTERSAKKLSSKISMV